MKIVLKKSSTWSLLFLLLALLLLVSTQPAIAQTDPETTPTNGYPPPATPAQLEEAYPNQLPPPTSNAVNEAYVAPTEAAIGTTNSPPAIVGESAAAATAVATTPISQSALVRNRAILWAGFLITLILFLLAVYGAMLMYRRPRN